MYRNWHQIQERLEQKDADGRLLLAVKGDESVEELREIAESILFFCPAAQTCAECPFTKLAKLSDQSMHKALTLMNRENLLELFKLEQECRAQALENSARSPGSIFNSRITGAS